MPKNLDNPDSLIPVRVAESTVTVGGEDERSRLRGKANAREADKMRKNTGLIVKEETKMRGESIIPAFCNTTRRQVSDKSRQYQKIIGHYSLDKSFHVRGGENVYAVAMRVKTSVQGPCNHKPRFRAMYSIDAQNCSRVAAAKSAIDRDALRMR